MSQLPESIAANVAEWTAKNQEHTDARAPDAWDREAITWGIFGIAEETLGSPLGEVVGRDVVELGCGTAYVSAWLAKLGARPVGVDPTPAQLDTARRMQERTGLTFPLIEAPAEQVPLPDASFDLAVSEYGASLWADPALWIPEVARLLRPGGRLVFLTNATLVQLCMPDVGGVDERLHRPQAGMYSDTWPDMVGIEYHLSHGDWIRLLRSHAFEIEDLIEIHAPAEAVQPPAGAEMNGYDDFVDADWARQWPAEEIWVARLRS